MKIAINIGVPMGDGLAPDGLTCPAAIPLSSGVSASVSVPSGDRWYRYTVAETGVLSTAFTLTGGDGTITGYVGGSCASLPSPSVAPTTLTAFDPATFSVTAGDVVRIKVTQSTGTLTGSLTVAPAPSLSAVTTENSATPSTPVLTMPAGYTVLAIYPGYGDMADPTFPVYVNDGTGTREFLCARLTRTLVKVAAGSTIALSSDIARNVSVVPVRSFSSLTSPDTVTGTANADDGDPYLWSPTAPHVTVPTRGTPITITAPGSGRRMVYYLSLIHI